MQKDTFQDTIGSHEQLNAIRSNDEKAMQLFYQANFPKVERYVLDNSGTKDEAKDIYQDAFIAVWRNIQIGRFDLQQGGSLDGYLYRVAKNKWIDHLRRIKGRQPVPLDGENLPVMINGQKMEESNEYLDVVKKEYLLLGHKCRRLLNLFYYQKYSLREIAGFFKWTEASAKNNKYRCLEELRVMVKKKIQNGPL